jgi:hypothetical protein
VGIWVDGAGRCADSQTPRALLGLGVKLHKMKGPKQVLWAANLWEEGVPVKQHPYSFDNEHARPKKIPKVPGLRRRRVVFWISRANASKSGMGMWPGAYCVKSSSEALLTDIVLAAVEDRRGGVILCFVVC